MTRVPDPREALPELPFETLTQWTEQDWRNYARQLFSMGAGNAAAFIESALDGKLPAHLSRRSSSGAPPATSELRFAGMGRQIWAIVEAWEAKRVTPFQADQHLRALALRGERFTDAPDPLPNSGGRDGLGPVTYPEPLRVLGARLAELLDSDHWNNVEPMLHDIGELLQDRGPSSGAGPDAERKPSTGAIMIAAERMRQQREEGWTPAHDDAHTDESLALAAAVYAWPAPRPLEVKKAWPWDRRWFKLTIPEGGIASTEAEKRLARIRDLEKTGALIAAEIDRLLRVASSEDKR